MTVIFHMTICVCWSVCCGLSLISLCSSRRRRREVSLRMWSICGGRAEWLAEQHREMLHWQEWGFLCEKWREIPLFVLRPTSVDSCTYTWWNTPTGPQRSLQSQQTERRVTRGVVRRLWNQLFSCKNGLPLFVQSGQPGRKPRSPAVNFQITSPPSVESSYVLTADRKIWPKLMCFTFFLFFFWHKADGQFCPELLEEPARDTNLYFLKRSFNRALNKEQILVYRNGLSK